MAFSSHGSGGGVKPALSSSGSDMRALLRPVHADEVCDGAHRARARATGATHVMGVDHDVWLVIRQ